jgi:hypothetical protein
MAAAMAQGDSEDSEMEELDSDSEGLQPEEDDEEELDDEDDDEEETGSFHTDSEDEEEEEELDDDESERLEEEGPLDDKTRQLRARMQAMMEAAEGRARGDAPSPPPKKSALKQKSKTTEKPKPVEEDEDAGYDLAPLSRFGKPLSAEVLRKAEEADKARIAKKAEQAALAKSKGKEVKRIRKKRKVEPTTRVISYVPYLRHLSSGCGLTTTERTRLYMFFPLSSAPTSPRMHYRQSWNLA